VRPRAGRLVRPRHVRTGQCPIQLPRQDVKTYGHPSQFGYKDICHIWRAENWDPEELIRLYAKTGAKYLVALGNHHDNFDCWNSKHQPWNCINVGPKKDIVGTWAKIARAHGSSLQRCHHDITIFAIPCKRLGKQSYDSRSMKNAKPSICKMEMFNHPFLHPVTPTPST